MYVANIEETPIRLEIPWDNLAGIKQENGDAEMVVDVPGIRCECGFHGAILTHFLADNEVGPLSSVVKDLYCPCCGAMQHG